jgi:hypothetical protein
MGKIECDRGYKSRDTVPLNDFINIYDMNLAIYFIARYCILPVDPVASSHFGEISGEIIFLSFRFGEISPIFR